MSVEAVDISNWTGTLEAGEVSCLTLAGIRHVVVRASLESHDLMGICLQQIDALLAAGLDVSVYLWVYPDEWNPEQTVIDTVALLAGRPVTWFWLDVEQLPEGVSVAQYEDWIARALAECERQGKRGGIYTGRWYWADPTHLNNSTKFKDVPLWVASFDKNGDFRGGGLPFGGWTEPPFGEQYEGSGQQSLCGLFVDRSVFQDAILTPPPVSLTPDELRYGLVKRVVAGEFEELARDLANLGVTP